MLNIRRLGGIQSIRYNHKIFNIPGFHTSSNFEKKKPTILQSLINHSKNAEEGVSENSLDDIFKRVRNQNQKEQKRKDYLKVQEQNKIEAVKKQKKIMEKYDENTDKKGKDFWFKKKKKNDSRNEIQSSIETHIQVEGEKEQQENSLQPDEFVLSKIEEKEDFQMDDLKKRLEDNSSEREVSKLMTAMIDSIDQKAENIEDNLQKLIEAFNVSETKRPQNRKGRRQEEDQSNQGRTSLFKRKSTTKTSFNNPTNLFGNASSTLEEELPTVNLFQMKWNEELKDLLPEMKPKNAFELRMLDIDREWNFPIDNEQDMGMEEITSFDEHVFLDHLLEEFPEEGPVYKFMELVVTGLQQNPYLSVEEKTNQVLWFKDYFGKFPDKDLQAANLEF